MESEEKWRMKCSAFWLHALVDAEVRWEDYRASGHAAIDRLVKGCGIDPKDVQRPSENPLR